MRSKVEVTDNELYIRFIHQKSQLNISEINTILINRVTPLYWDNLNEKNITWRENLIINNQLSLSGFMFSDLNKLVERVRQQNPEAKIEYYINTIQDNVLE